jgi:hypothetical protein
MEPAQSVERYDWRQWVVALEGQEQPVKLLAAELEMPASRPEDR